MKKRERKPKGKKGKDKGGKKSLRSAIYYELFIQNKTLCVQNTDFGICLVTKILKGDLDQLLTHSGRLQSI